VLEASLLQQNPEHGFLLFLRVYPGGDLIASMDELGVFLQLFLSSLQPKKHEDIV
jgi:hypothetical protein